MKQIVELFGVYTDAPGVDWASTVANQQCPFLHRRCYKVRKSSSDISIGTCTVMHGKQPRPVVICPTRLIDGGQIFTDCIHLLSLHQPGNELHLVPEVSIPGGSVDFFLVSAKLGKVVDFVGIELQTMDTTGTVWPARQRLLDELHVPRPDEPIAKKGFGMNWKMTAKTILVQMHHKAETFEHLNRKLVLVIQDDFLDYMKREFTFDHFHSPVSVTDSVHFHAYGLEDDGSRLDLNLKDRLSTDADGVSTSLGLQAEAKVELEVIVRALESKLSPATRFQPVGLPTAAMNPPAEADLDE